MIAAADEETGCRSRAAPGLAEDELVAAMSGLPVPGRYWGDGWVEATRRREGPWSEERERRRRHEELLDKWRAEAERAPGPRP